MSKRTICAVVAAISMAACNANFQNGHSQQSNLPGIELRIGDLKGCAIEFNDNDRNEVIDEIVTSAGIGEANHKLHDMTSTRHRPEILRQIQSIYLPTATLFHIMRNYDNRIQQGQIFDEEDTDNPVSLMTNGKGNILFKGITLNFNGAFLSVYDMNYDGIADLVLYRTELGNLNPAANSQGYFNKGFKNFCDAQNRIKMSEQVTKIASQILQKSLGVFSKFETGIVMDRGTEDSYTTIGGWRGKTLYHLGNVP